MSASVINRRFHAPVCMLLVLTCCIGCVGPLLGKMRHHSDCTCGDTCDSEMSDCDGSSCKGGLNRCPSVQAGWRGAYEKCAGLVPCGSPSIEVAPSDIPPPSRFHPVPTRPVFGSGYEAL